MTKSKKTSKTHQKFHLGMEPKFRILHPTCFYFGLALDPPLGGSGRKTKRVRDYEHLIPTKFHKYPSIGSVGKADNVFPYINVH